MQNQTSALDKGIDKILSKLPKEPKTQLRFMYYLNGIIVVTLFAFTISNIITYFKTGTTSFLFGAVLTTVFGAMSLFSFKQTREGYKAICSMPKEMQNINANEITPEQIEAIINKQLQEQNLVQPQPTPEIKVEEKQPQPIPQTVKVIASEPLPAIIPAPIIPIIEEKKVIAEKKEKKFKERKKKFDEFTENFSKALGGRNSSDS